MYDPESIIQDADIEQTELEAAGYRIAVLKKKGICIHGHFNTQSNECYSCGKHWENTEKMLFEIDKLSQKYL